MRTRRRVSEARTGAGLDVRTRRRLGACRCHAISGSRRWALRLHVRAEMSTSSRGTSGAHTYLEGENRRRTSILRKQYLSARDRRESMFHVERSTEAIACWWNSGRGIRPNWSAISVLLQNASPAVPRKTFRASTAGTRATCNHASHSSVSNSSRSLIGLTGRRLSPRTRHQIGRNIGRDSRYDEAASTSHGSPVVPIGTGSQDPGPFQLDSYRVGSDGASLAITSRALVERGCRRPRTERTAERSVAMGVTHIAVRTVQTMLPKVDRNRASPTLATAVDTNVHVKLSTTSHPP